MRNVLVRLDHRNGAVRRDSRLRHEVDDIGAVVVWDAFKVLADLEYLGPLPRCGLQGGELVGGLDMLARAADFALVYTEPSGSIAISKEGEPNRVDDLIATYERSCAALDAYIDGYWRSPLGGSQK